MAATMSLSPQFLDDLAKVHSTLRPPAVSPAFLSDLEKVFGTLPALSDATLKFLADRFDKWRQETRERVRRCIAELSDDDPLKCPISLFRTMDYGRLETAHTRTLAWLLNSEAEHGFGTTLVAALLRCLSGKDCSAGLQIDRVQSEVLIDGVGDKGRLDVLAEGTWEKGKPGDWVLVIEAKIDAGEGEDQLQKYEKWLPSRAASHEVFRVFLTPDGRQPETGAEDWEPMAFLELVRIFRGIYGELRNRPGFHFLRFYLAGVLQDVCGFPRNVTGETPDPYAILSYLQTIDESRSEGPDHDAPR
jgi:hypothetical protein